MEFKNIVKVYNEISRLKNIQGIKTIFYDDLIKCYEKKMIFCDKLIISNKKLFKNNIFPKFKYLRELVIIDSIISKYFKFLDLEKIVGVYIHDSTIYDVNNLNIGEEYLNHLSISDSRIDELPDISKYINLVTFSMSNVKTKQRNISESISNINLSSLVSFKISDMNLKYLDFSNNITSKFISIQNMNLSNNKLSSIRFGKKFHCLNNMNLSNNKLTEIPLIEHRNDLSYDLRIKKLDLSHNNIKILDLDKIPACDELILSHNNIEKIIGNPLNIWNTKILNLSHNNISDFKNIPYSPKLKSLDLSHNKIVSLKDYPSEPPYEDLNLSYNKLKNLIGIKINKRRPNTYISIDVSNNKLSSFEGFVLPEKNNNMFTYIFHDNPIKSIKGIDIDNYKHIFIMIKNYTYDLDDKLTLQYLLNSVNDIINRYKKYSECDKEQKLYKEVSHAIHLYYRMLNGDHQEGLYKYINKNL